LLSVGEQPARRRGHRCKANGPLECSHMSSPSPSLNGSSQQALVGAETAGGSLPSLGPPEQASRWGVSDSEAQLGPLTCRLAADVGLVLRIQDAP
jgi:hypothetical protein